MDLWTIAEYATGLFLIFCMGGLILSLQLRQKNKEHGKPSAEPSHPLLVAHSITIADSAGTAQLGCFLLGLRFTGDKTDIFVGAWPTVDVESGHFDTWCAAVDSQGALTACGPNDLERVRREVARVQTMLNSRSATLDLLMRDLWAQKKRSDRLSHSHSPLHKRERKALAEALERTQTRLGSELSGGSCQILLLPQLLVPVHQLDVPLRCESLDQLTPIPLNFSVEDSVKELLKAAAGNNIANTAQSTPAEPPETRKEPSHETAGN